MIFLSGNLFSALHYVQPVSAGTGDGSSWANASNDLQLMINSASSGDEIWVAAGTYIPVYTANTAITASPISDPGNVADAFVLKSGIKIYGGFTGTETSFSARNWRTNTTVLSGQLNGTTRGYHVFIISGNLGTNACLDGFTISGGKGYSDATKAVTVNGNTIDSRRGAGIYNVGTSTSSPVIRNLTITGNESVEAGGGAGVFCGTGNNTRIENVIITSNTQGSGVRLAQTAAPVLINCLITKNTTSGNGGGIVVTETTALPTIINCTIADNTAANYGIFTATPIIMANSIVWGNTGTQVTFNLTGSSVNYCLIQNTTPAGTGNLNGSSAGNAPQFIDTANGNYQLASASTSVDKGNNASYSTYGMLASDVDNAGNPRLSNTTIDLGAFEYQNPGLGTGENGLSDDLMGSIFIYPNPATNFVSISSVSENTIVKIIDINGKLIQNVTNNLNRVNLNLNAGIYFIKIEDGKKNSVQKLIVK